MTLLASRERLRVLMPGEWSIAEREGAIETLLGSCVALAIWDPVTATGACCHFILPGNSAIERSESSADSAGKYGRSVIPAMWRALRGRGIPPDRCVHKLFGGGRMFRVEMADIGAQNIACAREALQRANIAVAAESVGGDGHRKIRFDVASGRVAVEFHPLSGCPAREFIS